MNKKNDIEVIINNKRYVLCGYESDEYLQKVASYINRKYEEFKQQDGYNILDADMRNILMQINITDDFFKAQKQVTISSNRLEDKDKEIFDMKHEVISHQTKLEAIEKEKLQLEKDYLELQKKVIKLETELEGKSKER